MKNKVVLILAFLILTSTSAFAKTGVGVIGSYGLNTSAGGAALSLSSPVIPGTIFNISYSNKTLTFSDDWWLYNSAIGGDLGLYAGLGGYVQMKFYDNFSLNMGARVPVGLRIFPLSIMELFIEIVPVIGMDLSPFTFPVWDVHGAFGIRLWFD